MAYRSVALAGVEFERHIVQRRYSSFLALEAQLRPHFLGLPPLPPKSNFRKRLRPSSFMADRERKLGVFLAAVLSADASASTQELRRFLAVGMLSSVFARPSGRDSYNEEQPSSASASSLGHSTILSIISEAEEGDMIESFNVDGKAGSLADREDGREAGSHGFEKSAVLGFTPPMQIHEHEHWESQ